MAVMFQRVAHTDLISSLWFQKTTNHLPLFLLLFLKIAIGLFFILSVFTGILGFSKFIAFAAACILAKFIYSSEYFVERYLQIESQFLINLNAKTLAERKSILPITLPGWTSNYMSSATGSQPILSMAAKASKN